MLNRGPTHDWDIVVISTHFDDAALSLGGFLGRSQGRKAIATVHAGRPDPDLPVSWWDAACGFLSGQEAHQVRLAEDARACALLGVDQVTLSNPDSPYRGGGPLAELDEFLLSLPPFTEVLAPLGVRQPDHARVRDHTLATLTSAGRALPKLYADLPYAAVAPGWGAGSGIAALAEFVESGEEHPIVTARFGLSVKEELRLDGQDWIRKRDAILCYASQLGPVASIEDSELGALLRFPGPLQFEVIWEIDTH